jgi:DNA-binding SARP family transcriptional activator
VPRFRLLGPLEVRVGQEWRAIGAPKWRAILAVLLLNAGQIVPAAVLWDAVWGDDVPANAPNLISIYIMRLRRLLGDADGTMLVTSSPGYRLRLGPLDTDVQVFEELIRDCRQLRVRSDPQGAADKAREALALWRGRPLADVLLAPGTDMEAETERLAELRINAVELRISAELDYGGQQPVDAVTELQSLLDDNPLRENLWLLLMRTLESTGRHADAIDAYEQARTVIADELGVDPGVELRRFHEQLLAADAAPGSQTSPVPAARPAQSRQQRLPVPAPERAAGRENLSRALTALTHQEGLPPEQVASMTGLAADTTARWCVGSHLPPLTSDGLAGLRAILAACEITGADEILAWTDALIRAQAQAGSDLDPPAPDESARPAPPVPDRPGYDLCPDPLQARTPPEFVQALAGFRIWAGKPPLRDIERACGHQVSIATMSIALRGNNLPPLRTVLAIVRGCGGTSEHQERFATAWRMLQAPPGRRGLYPVPDAAKRTPLQVTSDGGAQAG